MIELRPLWEIQVLDLRRRSLENSLQGGNVAAELRALKMNIEENRALFNSLKEEYSQLKKELKKRELDTDELKGRVEEFGGKLYDGSITNPKEIQNSSKKFESLKDEVKRTEELTLMTMESLEEMRQRLEGLSTDLSVKALHFRQLHGTYLGNQQKIKKLLAQIPQAREKLLEKVEVGVWKKYVEMKKKLADPLAKVEKGTCMGCRVGLSFHDLRTLKAGEDLHHCQNCGRMLFWER